MAEQKISELPIAAALDGTESLPVNQNAITSLTDVDAIVTYTLTGCVTGTYANPTSITVVKGLITAIS
jgi:hypothetical protein